MAALGVSSSPLPGAARDSQMEAWLRLHVDAFEYFGGIPLLVVPRLTKESGQAVPFASRMS